MKILILRVAPAILIDKIIEYCLKRWPESLIYVLRQKDSSVGLRNIDKVFILEAKASQISYSDIQNAIKEVGCFDAVFLPYNNPRGETYYSKELMLAFSSIKDIYTYNGHDICQKVSRLKLVCWRLTYGLFRIRWIDDLSGYCFYYLLQMILPFLIKFIFSKKKNKHHDILFVTNFGYRLPSARIRAYNFSRVLNSLGVDSKVLSMEDDFGYIADNTLAFENFIGVIKLAKRLCSYSKETVFSVLRPHFHSMAVYWVHRLRGNKIAFDHDDYDFKGRVFGTAVLEGDVARKMWDRSACNIVSSQYLKDIVGKQGHCSFPVITGVDIDSFYPFEAMEYKKKDSAQIICGWVGILWGKKVFANLLFLFKCFKEIDNPNIVLHIAAGGTYLEIIRRKAEKMLGNRVVFYNLIPPDKVPDFLNSVDIGVIPFVHDNEYNRSKSPTKLFEFMACAKPCITSPIGEMNTIVEHEKSGFLAKDKKEFIYYLNRLANDHQLRAQIGNAARKRIEEKYTLSACGREYYNVLKAKGVLE